MYNLRYQNDDVSFEVDFKRISDHVVEIKGAAPIKPDGFFLSRIGFADNWNYTDYSTPYKKIEGGVQFSNDGSVWVEPTRDVEISVTWNDAENALEKRPDAIGAVINELPAIIEAPDWKIVYEDEPESRAFTVNSAEEVEGYELSIEGLNIVYAIPKPYEPTLEEQIAELTDVVADIDERVYALEEA